MSVLYTSIIILHAQQFALKDRYEYQSRSEEGGSNFFETFITIHQTTWCHVPEGRDFETDFFKETISGFGNCIFAAIAYIGRHAHGYGDIRIRGKIILKRSFSRK